VVSLADALDDPGDHAYSPEARTRFADLAQLIGSMRRHAGDPLVELVRRAVRVLDLDIELQAGDVEGATDNLALFIDAVADYAESDRFASLGGLLGYLQAEQEFNLGMEVSTPSEAESVKLLTIHKAKGLEWHTVFVPLMSATVFPSGLGRPNWLTTQTALPTALRGDRANLPQLPDDPRAWSPDAAAAHNAGIKDLALMEERRLAYVAYTRAADRLVLSGHWWGRTQLKPRGPGTFLIETKRWLEESGGRVDVWAAAPDQGTVNPHLAQQQGEPWPSAAPELRRRHALADAVLRRLAGSIAEPARPSDPFVAARLETIEADIELLLAEASAAATELRAVDIPATVSTTSMLALAKDPSAFARGLARPMPRRPSAAARFGTRFHAWVEAYFGHQGVLLDPEDLPGRGDADIESDAELHEVIARFQAGPYADLTPVAIEAPFSLVLAGHQVVGQIDAVFRTPEGYEVIDWKTNRKAEADPLQLAVYRLAWAELMGIDPARVSAAFYYVRRGEVLRFKDLPGRAELQVLWSAGGTVLG
jgi:DNA helicase-2/ATP-dependent DNA helicase PcrA